MSLLSCIIVRFFLFAARILLAFIGNERVLWGIPLQRLPEQIVLIWGGLKEN